MFPVLFTPLVYGKQTLEEQSGKALVIPELLCWLDAIPAALSWQEQDKGCFYGVSLPGCAERSWHRPTGLPVT